MKTTGFSALALLVALLLYVGSTGPYMRLGEAGLGSSGYWRLSKVYLPLTLLRGTPAEGWLNRYVRSWSKGNSSLRSPVGLTFLDWVVVHQRTTDE